MGLSRFALANAGQPQYEAQLDRSNPLVSRLRYAQLGSSLRDAVSGRFGVDSGGSTKAVGLKGATREFVPASNQYVNLGTKDICSGYPLTVASWIRWDDVSATGFVAYSLNDTNCSAILGALGGSGWAANASSATGFQQKGAQATGLNHFVTIHRNGTWDIYVNGVIQPNGGNVSAWGQPAAGNHSIGGRLGGASLRPMDGQVQDLQVYQGELTPTEIQSLYRNHWQIWQAPGPSLILPLPSSGATSHSSTGVLVAQDAVIAGAATVIHLHPTTGALVAQDAVIVGASTVIHLHPTSGALVAGAAVIAGDSVVTHTHPATGVLVAQAASISGTAVVATVGTHASSGALAAQTAVIDGASTVVHKFPTTGVLVAAAATISGSAVVTPQSVTHPSTGQLVSDAAVVSGSAQVVRGAISRPSSDTSAGAWTPSTGSDLYAMIDEVSPDDSDYIIATTATSCTLALSSVADPLTSSGQVVSYRAWSSTSNGLTVTLKQGATTIATWTHATLPTTATTYQQALTSGECDAITDYSNLSLVMTST